MVAAVLVLAACGAADEDEPDAAGFRPPDGALEIEGELYPLGLGTHCWRDDEETAFLCVDAIGIVTAQPYGRSSAGATLALAGGLAAADVAIASAQLWPAPEEPIEVGDEWEAWQPPEIGVAELAGTEATLKLPEELEPGPYLLAVQVHEEELGNSATYGAIVEVGSR